MENQTSELHNLKFGLNPLKRKCQLFRILLGAVFIGINYAIHTKVYFALFRFNFLQVLKAKKEKILTFHLLNSIKILHNNAALY